MSPIRDYIQSVPIRFVSLSLHLCPKSLYSPLSLLFSQTNQSVFIKLLQSSFRIYSCTWINSPQKANIESCIKTLADVGECCYFAVPPFGVEMHLKLRHLILHPLPSAKARAIAIPVDLDSQVNTLSLKVHSTMVQRAAKDWRISARTRPRKEPLGGPDYKNIIEKLQVRTLSQQSTARLAALGLLF